MRAERVKDDLDCSTEMLREAVDCLVGKHTLDKTTREQREDMVEVLHEIELMAAALGKAVLLQSDKVSRMLEAYAVSLECDGTSTCVKCHGPTPKWAS